MQKVTLISAKNFRKYFFGFFLVFILALRFFFELRLASRFEVGQGVKLKFCLTNQPYYGKTSQTFYYQNHFQRIKIRTNLDKIYDFGDCLQITGRITSCPQPSKTKYCLLNSVVSTYQPSVKFVFLKKLSQVRQKLSNFYLQNLPYPYADLLSGIVLGVKKDLDEQFYNQLRQTGALHIIVASGFNLTVSAEKPAIFLAYLIGRTPALIIGIIIIWFYVFLVGWQPPVVRAGLMLTTIFFAQLLGRKFYQWRALIFVVWLMLMVKPDLVASISFQLSFAALLGIMLGGIVFKKIKNVPILGKDLSETISAQFMVAPIIAYHFGRLSLLAPITNALILPLVPYITVGGISALLGSFLPFVGRFVLIVLYPFLWWSVKVVRWFSQLPLTEIDFSLPFFGVIIAYLVIFGVFHIKSTDGKRKKNNLKQRKLFPDY
jgi:ComEC/Rec2-related protein